MTRPDLHIIGGLDYSSPVYPPHSRIIRAVQDYPDLYASFEAPEQVQREAEPVHVPFGEAAFMMLVAALVCALLAGGGW